MFDRYFELLRDTDEVLAGLGYEYARRRLALPRSEKVLTGVDAIAAQMEEMLPFVSLSSDRAKRAVLIAPVLTKVAVLCTEFLRFEYWLKANNQLYGHLDYLIRGRHPFVVLQAKHDDMERGFTQLAVEMIALSMTEEMSTKVYGAVTIGRVWKFGILDSQAKLVTEDVGGYRVPDDIEDLMRALVGILE